jgi:hypothetical protein
MRESCTLLSRVSGYVDSKKNGGRREPMGRDTIAVA